MVPLRLMSITVLSNQLLRERPLKACLYNWKKVVSMVGVKIGECAGVRICRCADFRMGTQPNWEFDLNVISGRDVAGRNNLIPALGVRG